MHDTSRRVYTSSYTRSLHVAYDDHNLYVAFECFDEDPSQIRASFARRDLAEARASLNQLEGEAKTEALAGVAEAWAEWGETILEKGDLMFAPVRERFESGQSVDAATYLRNWRRIQELRAVWNARVEAYDAVMIPTAPILPPNAERLLTDQDYFVTENLLALRNTRIGNVMGLCALTLPTAAPSCGVMMMGKPFGEAALCRIGAAAEAVLAGAA